MFKFEKKTRIFVFTYASALILILTLQVEVFLNSKLWTLCVSDRIVKISLLVCLQ